MRIVDDSSVEPACRGDVDLFFSTRRADVDEAKAICASCLLVDDCLERAMYLGSDFGVWGGKTPVERRQIRRARLATA